MSFNCLSIASRYPVDVTILSRSDSVNSWLKDFSWLAASAFAFFRRSVGIDNVTFRFCTIIPPTAFLASHNNVYHIKVCDSRCDRLGTKAKRQRLRRHRRQAPMTAPLPAGGKPGHFGVFTNAMRPFLGNVTIG